MKFITWNVNSIRTRLERVIGVLERHQPDVLMLQETKVTDDIFPHEVFAEAGYTAFAHGQKTYNGVAILVRAGLEVSDVVHNFPGNPVPEQARVISATIEGVRFINLYVVNGKSADDPAFAKKLEWLDAIHDWLETQHDPDLPLVLGGDINIAPEARDVWDVEQWAGSVHFHPQEHARLKKWMDWGMTDLFRQHHEGDGLYSWWDYRRGAFGRGWGLRIDLLLATQAVSKTCIEAGIDRNERKKGDWEAKPSDHAPVWAVLS
ncbi:MAG: exodeoxyribonuclease III [Planctomycetes bacterium]|nr:exodeoxyribonuclease III [Planctomycetota bacterium]MBT4027967.1 exodeoxyribonuclease III [Planctomycetota bacterium]MBT4561143.1 exodeoxyribonuclease III [Planctomycetota bacterium]MBT5101766.1 exodeoxyribonuclease III [Planctomycetota bacterium]MBT5120893.1 exodeoxyribonuclease III [Planctomycetota bacterium]